MSRGESPWGNTSRKHPESPAKAGVSSDPGRPSHNLPSNLGPVQSGNQNRELRRRQNNRSVLNWRKSESAFLEPFCHEDHAGSVPDDHLEPVFPFRAEDENIAAI